MLSRPHYKLLEALRAGFPGGRPQGRVLAAVSGGSDSMALLMLLAAARERDDFALTAVYVDHATRVAAALESALVQATAARLGAGFECVTCAAVAHPSEGNLREARYAALRSVAARTGAEWIATGHTHDDQIETILFRFLRGSGRGGLAGIPRERVAQAARAQSSTASSESIAQATRTQSSTASSESVETAAHEQAPGDAGLGARATIVRPLLAVRRAELREYLRSLGFAWAEDPTNRDLRHARNRLRHVVIPAIERELGRGRLDHLKDVARTWALEDEFLEREAERHAMFAIRDRDGAPELDLVALEPAPPALRTRILRRWLQTAGFAGEPGLRILEAIDRMTASRAGSAELAVEGATVVREYTTLRLTRAPRATPFRIAVSADAAADYADPAGTWSLTVEPKPRGEAAFDDDSSLQVVEFLRKAVAPSLELRSPRAGDEIRFGPHGTRNVHDIMVEKHVPRRARQRWPVLVAGRTVIWVPGLAVDDGVTARFGRLGAERVRFAWRRLQK